MNTGPSIDEGQALIDIDFLPLDRVPDLKGRWTDLESRADGSFFLSWLWVGNWLEKLPRRARPHLLIARREGWIVGLAILCPRTIWRFGFLRTRCWFLHETGDALFDRLFVEYNGILADQSCAEAVKLACFRWLDRTLADGEELILGGLEEEAERAVRRVAAESGDSVQLRAADCAQWVDLDLVRRGKGGYRASLGRNTRSAVNRAAKLYAERGAVEFRVAESVEEALADFALLEKMHQARWSARGQAGAFDNPAFRPFHHNLIEQGVPTGAVRMCRTSVGGATIGVLYNFVHRGRVLNYQGGFAYEQDNRLKPGVLSHVLAIEDALARGESCYDFMSTPSGHKPLLSNAQAPMNWIAVGPDRMTRQAEAMLRQAAAQARQACRKVRRELGQLSWHRPAGF
ncbi:GNAT family N-acetyltransferase [Azospirillum sp. SYSU D00513]|uniref:GNAT family N-acetyltransferase n=1 Tax=Azospirillum sp. SYSU D00513 TaxID=2812561 RepID=UPI001A96B0ED|nr:GNAT family N-acetyltransferase [Azospirillum sp. SYSU D00513]